MIYVALIDAENEETIKRRAKNYGLTIGFTLSRPETPKQLPAVVLRPAIEYDSFYIFTEDEEQEDKLIDMLFEESDIVRGPHLYVRRQ